MASASTPATVSGIFQEADVYLRQAFFAEPKYERAYMKSLYKMPNFISLLSQLGLAKGADFKTFSIITLEEDQRSPIVTVAAQTAPAPGANISLAITGPYDDAGNCIAQERYTVYLANGMSGRVVSVTPTAFAYVVVLAPMTGPWPAIPAGTNLMFVASSVGAESTALPYYYTKGLTAYEHRLQALRLDTKINDFAGIADQNGRIQTYNSKMPTPWKGGLTNSWTTAQVSAWADQIESDINYAMLLADRDRLTVRSADGPSYMTGLYPAIRYGGGNNFLTPTTFSAAFFQNCNAAFRDSQVGGSVMNRTVLEGQFFQNKREDWLNTQTQTGNREQELDSYVYGCSEVRNIGGMNYKFVTCSDFNDPRSLGAMGFGNKAIMLPTDMTRQLSDGKNVPLFEMKYVEQPMDIQGAPNGMINFTYQAGPGFVGNGQQTNTTNAAASLMVTAIAKVGTVIRGVEAFGLCE